MSSTSPTTTPTPTATDSSTSSSIVTEWEQLNHQVADIADGIQIHFVDVGPRDATPVVLVHGWPDLAFAWRYQVGALATKYRVIAPDMRGFGRSSAPREVEAYGSKNVTSDLAKLLDFLNLPRAVFVGHDWGGNIIYRMALYHPTRVLAVVGICTPYYPPSDEYVSLEALAAAVPAFAYMQFLADTETASKHLEAAPRDFFTATYRAPQPPRAANANANTDVKGAPSVTFLDILRGVGRSTHPMYTHRSELLSEDELEFYVRAYSASGFKGACNYYATRALDFANERALPRVIPHRALYIGAGADPVLKPELAAHMPQVVPKLEFALVEGAGHWLLWSHKHEVVAVLLDWLAKLEVNAIDASP